MTLKDAPIKGTAFFQFCALDAVYVCVCVFEEIFAIYRVVELLNWNWGSLSGSHDLYYGGHACESSIWLGSSESLLGCWVCRL